VVVQVIEVEKLMQCLRELSSREFQADAWVRGEGPEGSSFSESVSQAYDDTGLSDAIDAERCPIELTPESFDALKDLDAAISRVEQGMPPTALLDAPAMKVVRRKAEKALALLEECFG
jgi:hypothetical protein